MSYLFPNYSRLPIDIQQGNGSYVVDSQGNQYLDLTSGIGVVNLGYGHPKVQAALMTQAEQIWHVPNLYDSQLQEEVAQKLTQNQKSASDEPYLAYFCNSGAEANEAALKLARKATGRSKVISFEQSFHGRTFGAMSLTGQSSIHDGFGPLVPEMVYVPFNDLEALQAVLDEQTAAVFLELIQGEGGVIPAEVAWVQAVAALCQELGVLLVVDEIQTGMGRTGTLFAFEGYGIEPDLFTVAKGLGNGIPVGAMLGKSHLQTAFGPGSHGSTFGGNKLAMAVASAVCSVLQEEDIQVNVQLRQQQFLDGLQGLSKVQAIRGKGLMIGIELADSESLQSVLTQLRNQGLLALKAGTKVLRLLPPLTISQEETTAALAILQAVLA
ncbi:acetylornithine transaminase [Enterococcus casseliflavus]|uniref:acetylornithine transaminase n=1 Tax=Enterococcus casseliflavus TaxID=37734 RepID=UPI001AD7381F|nr:acetylornithine transaminase [Enterococcus casseliflavus]MBO6350457.1 acetylornithine transaminase [Enterococcus casseliflavus]MBO6368522.1 acetylornithine transaminase [Enterococcus casseliflavus]